MAAGARRARPEEALPAAAPLRGSRARPRATTGAEGLWQAAARRRQVPGGARGAAGGARGWGGSTERAGAGASRPAEEAPQESAGLCPFAYLWWFFLCVIFFFLFFPAVSACCCASIDRSRCLPSRGLMSPAIFVLAQTPTNYARDFGWGAGAGCRLQPAPLSLQKGSKSIEKLQLDPYMQRSYHDFSLFHSMYLYLLCLHRHIYFTCHGVPKKQCKLHLTVLIQGSASEIHNSYLFLLT